MIASCTVTKRKHLRGFHIEWRKKNTQAKVERAQEVKALLSSDTQEVVSQNTEIKLVDHANSHYDEVTTDELVESSLHQIESRHPIVGSNETSIAERYSSEPKTVKYVHDEALEGTVRAGWIIVIIGGALILCVIIALTGIIDFSSILGLLIMILGGLIGLGLIAAFGLTGAFLFGLSVAVFGLFLVMIGAIPLARRNRYKEELPKRFRNQ
jgi:hypothetical protein